MMQKLYNKYQIAKFQFLVRNSVVLALIVYAIVAFAPLIDLAKGKRGE